MRKLLSQEHRCICGKLLLKGVIFDGFIEIKCKHCGSISNIGDVKLVNDDIHYALILNKKGIITNADASSSKILGYSYEELIGKRFTQINPTMPAEIGDKFFGPKSLLSEENYFRLDTFHRSKDGKNIPITAFLKLFKSNDKERDVMLMAELRDIGKEKNNSKSKTLKFIDNACDFYFDVDKEGIIEYLSPSVEKIFKFPLEKILGKVYFNYLCDGTKDEVINTFKHFVSKEQPFRVMQNLGKDCNGKIMHNQLFFTPKFNDLSKFVGYRVLGWELKNPKQKTSRT